MKSNKIYGSKIKAHVEIKGVPRPKLSKTDKQALLDLKIIAKQEAKRIKYKKPLVMYTYLRGVYKPVENSTKITFVKTVSLYQKFKIYFKIFLSSLRSWCIRK